MHRQSNNFGYRGARYWKILFAVLNPATHHQCSIITATATLSCTTKHCHVVMNDFLEKLKFKPIDFSKLTPSEILSINAGLRMLFSWLWTHQSEGRQEARWLPFHGSGSLEMRCVFNQSLSICVSATTSSLRIKLLALAAPWWQWQNKIGRLDCCCSGLQQVKSSI